MSILDEFTETTNSDNRYHNLDIEKDLELIIGGTCTHIFILPFKYSEYIGENGVCKILYRQGLYTVLEKYATDGTVEEKADGTTVLSLTLSTTDTLKFNKPILKTSAQIKVVTNDGKTLYSKLNKIKVFTTIADLNDPN